MTVRRRDFLTLIGGTAAWPLAARAQQPSMPVIGYLDSAGPDTGAGALDRFHRALAQAGYKEDNNIAVEYRWADGQYDRLPALAADLVRRRVAVIFTVLDPNVALAAKAATTTIPIVFVFGNDPVRFGLVASLNKPGGNITGVSFFTGDLVPKRLELLHQLVPQAATIAFLVNPPSRANTELAVYDIEAAARTIGQQIIFLNAGAESEMDKAFATMVEQQVGAFMVNGDRVLAGSIDRIVALAARHRIPGMYWSRSQVERGGLMSYGNDPFEPWRHAGDYVRRVLKGERPGDLPVVQPTKFELVINLKTAKALGLTVPLTLRALANEVIE